MPRNTSTPRDPNAQRRTPGFTARRHRVLMEKAVLRAKVLREHPTWNDDEVAVEVESRYEVLLPRDPKVLKFYEETAPVSVCPDRRPIVELAEVHAIRQLAQMVELEERLTTVTHGRPTDRKLMVAVLERLLLESGRPEVQRCYKEFRQRNDVLHWAYDFPAYGGRDRHQSNIYRTIHSALARYDEGLCLAANMAAIAELRAGIGDPDIGRYLAIDGTKIVAPREQRQHDPNWPEEEPYLRNGLQDADFAYHAGRDRWRGYRLIIIVDLKTTLPLGFVLKPASRPEHEVVEELLQLIHRLWNEHVGEPWTPEYIVGDSHYDTEEVCRLLEERYGIHPVFARHGRVSESFPWGGDHEGTPYCSSKTREDGSVGEEEHGYMKRVQPQYFVDSKKRVKLGLEPGEPADLSKAGFRWECRRSWCQTCERTRWADNPRLYTYVSRKGVHHKYPAFRTALMLRRNAVESLNASLKNLGIGKSGVDIPKWIAEDREMSWLCFGTCLAHTLRRLAHESGKYERSHADAASKDLLRATTPADVIAIRGNDGPPPAIRLAA